MASVSVSLMCLGPETSRCVGTRILTWTMEGLAWSHSRGSYRWDTVSALSHTNKMTLATDHELSPAGFLNDLLNFLPVLPRSHTLWKPLHPDPLHTNITKIPGLKPSAASQGCIWAGLRDSERLELHEVVGGLSPMCSGQAGPLQGGFPALQFPDTQWSTKQTPLRSIHRNKAVEVHTSPPPSLIPHLILSPSGLIQPSLITLRAGTKW